MRLKNAIVTLCAVSLLAGGNVFAEATAQVTARDPVRPSATDMLRRRPPSDEVIYFVLPDRFANGNPRNDRGGLSGDRMHTGFDPSHKGFYHGGDLAGLLSQLDYIQAMGVTAIWFAPVFKNKPVQGGPGQESAGYHGYWVTDFTTIDPHFGTEAEFRAFVDAAHARGMKVYMDIITNHTADVIQYAECPTSACAYRSVADFPYQRRARDGAAINAGFMGDDVQTSANFARLSDTDYAYTVRVPAAEMTVKVPAWLNDPRYYHNRGDSHWRGESSLYGDFVGLDDLLTEHPRVVQGFIDIYGDWIDRFGIDGFRIDTARHVNPEFWQAFVPAMQARAAARGILNFHIFGESYREGVEPGLLALYTRRDGFPAVLDFSFQALARGLFAGNEPTDLTLRLLEGDYLYAGGPASTNALPTFLGNHDMGRMATFIRQARPGITETELLQRLQLAQLFMFAMRGTPTIYSGDEQGFIGDGNDQDAREDMFASRVASYNDNDLVGSDATTATSNFNRRHPLYRQIAALARLRAQLPLLRHGATVLREGSDAPGLLAFSRVDSASADDEVLVAINTGATPLRRRIEVNAASRNWAIANSTGGCRLEQIAPGSVEVSITPLGGCIWHTANNR